MDLANAANEDVARQGIATLSAIKLKWVIMVRNVNLT